MKNPIPTRHPSRAKVLITSITDGDTFRGSWHHGDVTIRLLGFDAPEIGQACGGWAAAMVRRILTGRILTPHTVSLDRYGRTVMDLRWPDGGRVSLTLLEMGLGHVDKRFARGLHEMQAAERYAQARRLGIWQHDTPTPPWRFRRYRPSTWLARRAKCHIRFRR